MGTTQQTQAHYDVVIVGGGLVGLCVAFHLAASRLRVGILLGTQSGQASLAAAGMLTPTCEWDPETSPAFLALLRSGRAYYDEFLPHLLGPSDLAEVVGYSERHYLLLDLLENGQDLSQRFARLQAAGAQVEWLRQRQVYQVESAINPDAIRGAMRIAGDGLINPRALRQRLCERVAHHATRFDANLLAVEERGSDFALRLDDGRTIVCSRVVIAAGAWSCEVGAHFHLDIPVTLSKGQMIQFSGPPGLLRHNVYMPAGACGCFLERAPGVYIAGTSEEFVAAEISNTSKVIAAILTRVNNVMLPAGDLVIEDMWSGLRPITPDELPIISRTDDPRIILATGHYRNGVLLAPLTGRIVRSLLEGSEPEVDIQPYRYQRVFHAQYRFASAY